VDHVPGASRSAAVLVARLAHARRRFSAVEPERTPAAVVVVAFHVTVTDPVTETDVPAGEIPHRNARALQSPLALRLLLITPDIKFESAAVDPVVGKSKLHPLDGGAWHEPCGVENAEKRQLNSGGGGNPLEQVAVEAHPRAIIQ